MIKSKESISHLQKDMLQIIKLFYDRQWSLATSTNYSFRVPEEDLICISKSGVDKGRFRQEDFMLVDMEGNPLPDYEDYKPSAEMQLHLMLFEDSNVQAVLHTHSVAGTVISRKHDNELRITGFEMMKGFAQVESHEEEITIPIFPNSQDIPALSKDISNRIKGAKVPAVLIAGHGLYAWGTSIEEAQRHIETAEFLFQCLLQEAG